MVSNDFNRPWTYYSPLRKLQTLYCNILVNHAVHNGHLVNDVAHVSLLVHQEAVRKLVVVVVSDYNSLVQPTYMK